MMSIIVVAALLSCNCAVATALCAVHNVTRDNRPQAGGYNRYNAPTVALSDIYGLVPSRA